MRFTEENEKCLLLCCWNESLGGKKSWKIYYLEVPGPLGRDRRYLMLYPDHFYIMLNFLAFFSSFEFAI